MFSFSNRCSIFRIIIIFACLFALVSIACGLGTQNRNSQEEVVVVTVVVTASPVKTSLSEKDSGNGDDVAPQTSQSALQEPIPTSTPVGIRNPTGIVSAETPILADDFQLTVSKELEIDTINNYKNPQVIGVKIVVFNTSGSQKIIRFNRAAFSLSDDSGNQYSAVTEGDMEVYYRPLQKSLKPGEALEIESEFQWPNDRWGNLLYIPYFQGPISPQAQSLILTIENFGPFPSLKVGIDL
jgi:hypothetical protein